MPQRLSEAILSACDARAVGAMCAMLIRQRATIFLRSRAMRPRMRRHARVMRCLAA